MKSTAWQADTLKALPIQIIDGDRSSKYPKQSEFQSSGVLFLNTTNIKDNRLDLSEANYVTEDKYAAITKGRVAHGDVVMTTRGTIGKVAYYSLVGRAALINAQMLIIRPDRNTFDSRFIFYIFCSEAMQANLRNFSSGSAQPQIPITDLREVTLRYPPLPIQRKISGVLSAYDDLIENNTRRIAILEEMAQAIYREWFVNFRFPGHENAKLINSPLGKIPEGWAATVADFGKVITGKTPTKTRPENFGGDIPFVKTPDMHGNLFCISTGETLSESGMVSQPSQTVPPNCVCISCIGTVGAISITTTTCQTNQQINTIIPHSPCWREFIVLCLRDSVARLKQMGAAGATMDNISKGKLMAFDVLLPPSNILEAFSSVTSELFDRIRLLQRQTNVLRITRDLLLPKLISGQLDVEELDIETGEPLVEAEA